MQVIVIATTDKEFCGTTIEISEMLAKVDPEALRTAMQQATVILERSIVLNTMTPIEKMPPQIREFFGLDLKKESE